MRSCVQPRPINYDRLIESRRKKRGWESHCRCHFYHRRRRRGETVALKTAYVIDDEVVDNYLASLLLSMSTTTGLLSIALFKPLRSTVGSRLLKSREIDRLSSDLLDRLQRLEETKGRLSSRTLKLAKTTSIHPSVHTSAEPSSSSRCFRDSSRRLRDYLGVAEWLYVSLREPSGEIQMLRGIPEFLRKICRCRL